MRAIYLGKDKKSAVAGLRYLVDRGVEVVAVVAPSEGALAAAATELGLPTTTDSALYDRLAGDDSAAPGVPTLEDVDLVLSFLFWKRIRKPLIELPRIGCLNFHPAPLPDYRGLGGYNAAILDGLEEWGVSAHFVDASFDTGDIFRVDRFPMDPDTDTAWSLEKRSQDHLLNLFRTVIEMALSGDPLPRTPQGDGRYIDREELERMKIVDPSDPPELIERRIRAFWFPPHRGANLDIGGRPYTLVSDALLARIAEELR